MEHLQAGLGQRLGGGLFHRDVDGPDQLKDHADRVGGVQIVVHGVVKLLPVAVKGLGKGPLLGGHLPIGAVLDQKFQVALCGVQPVQGILGHDKGVSGIVQRRPILGREHKEADRLVPVGLRGLPHGKEIAQRLGHLLIVNVQEAVMQPVVDKFAAVGSLRLGNLVFMVGKLQVLPTAVDVDGLAQVAVGHGGTLDVPARPALSPGRVPIGLPRFRRLPEGEVQRVLLHIVHINAGPRLELLNGLVGEFPVIDKLFGAVVHISVHRVGIPLVNQGLHQVNDLLDVLRGLGVNGGVPHPQAMGVFEVLVDVLFRNGLGGGPLLIGPLDDLVVYIGEILHKGHLVAPVLQVAPQHVKEDHGAGVAHVNIVVDRGAAAIHLNLSGGEGDKLLFLPGHGVKQLHVGSPSCLSSLPVDGCGLNSSPARSGGS